MAAAPAAITGLAAGKELVHEGAGVVRAIMNALEKPIYSDVVVTETRKVKSDGTVVITTKTTGWTIPLGVPVLIIGGIALWEIGQAFADGVKGWTGGPGGGTVGFLLDPQNWIMQQILHEGQQQQNVKLPPSFMAQLSLLGQQILTPGTAGMALLLQKIGQQLKLPTA